MIIKAIVYSLFCFIIISCSHKTEKSLGIFVSYSEPIALARNYTHIVNNQQGYIGVDESGVYQLSEKGEELYSYHKKGRGPGALMYPSSIVVIGDNVYVSDMALNKIVLLKNDFAKKTFTYYDEVLVNVGNIVTLFNSNEKFVGATLLSTEYDIAMYGEYLEHLGSKNLNIERHPSGDNLLMSVAIGAMRHNVFLFAQVFTGILRFYNVKESELTLLNQRVLHHGSRMSMRELQHALEKGEDIKTIRSIFAGEDYFYVISDMPKNHRSQLIVETYDYLGVYKGYIAVDSNALKMRDEIVMSFMRSENELNIVYHDEHNNIMMIKAKLIL